MGCIRDSKYAKIVDIIILLIADMEWLAAIYCFDHISYIDSRDSGNHVLSVSCYLGSVLAAIGSDG